MKKEKCRVCGKTVKVMCQKNTGTCSELCANEWRKKLGESP